MSVRTECHLTCAATRDDDESGSLYSIPYSLAFVEVPCTSRRETSYVGVCGRGLLMVAVSTAHGPYTQPHPRRRPPSDFSAQRSADLGGNVARVTPLSSRNFEQ
eukprot:2126924-Prymnesium_polylepis.3